MGDLIFNRVNLGIEIDGRVTIIPAVTPEGIQYVRPSLTHQTTIQEPYDNASQFAAGTYNYVPPVAPLYIAKLVDWFTLENNNIFANKNRFTNSLGGSVFDGSDTSLISYVVDNYTGLGFYQVIQPNANWTTAMANAEAATFAGFSDWRLPNINEWGSIMNHNIYVTSIWNQLPLNVSAAQNFWSCSFVGRLPTSFALMSAGSNGTTVANNKVNSGSQILCRNHFN